MASSNYISFFTIFFIFNYSIADGSLETEEENSEMKYIAKEDTLESLRLLNSLGDDYGKIWIVLPDGNGTAQIAALQKSSSERIVTTSYTEKDMFEHVRFYLSTREHPEGKILDPMNLKTINFDPFKQTKIIAHGWRSSSKSPVITDIRDAYLKHQDVNVIAVDWSPIASDILYPNAAAATSEVGKFAGNIINSLANEKSAPYENFHFIGHSLGAHVAGFAGSTTEEKIGRITGLDPALPGFQYIKGPEGRLDATDANFVDVIHTCAGVLGMSALVGSADFYPNGGSPFQPGCFFRLLTEAEACSHSRSIQYFAESIENPKFKAVQCSDWDHFKRNECNNQYSDMGDSVLPTAKGVYYLKTATDSPFALDLNGTIF